MQEITSAATCLNQIPALFRKVEWVPGTVNLDYGGGKYEKATEFLADRGVTNMVYDPYNRSHAHNATVIHRALGNRPHTITLANVLNVIREAKIRHDVLMQLKGLLYEGGVLYISAYEGDRSGVGRETSKGWQENRTLKTYLEEIPHGFHSVTMEKSVIHCLK